MYWFLRTPIAAEAGELGVFEACDASWVLAGTCASLAFVFPEALVPLGRTLPPALGAIPPQCPKFFTAGYALMGLSNGHWDVSYLSDII